MKHVRLGILAASLMVAACSGGGDSFGGREEPSSSFRIDSGNAVVAARTAYEAAVDTGNLVGIGSAAGLSASSPDGGFAVAGRVGDPGGLFLGAISLVPFGPTTEICGSGPGTVTLSGDIASAGTLTPGDTFLIEYDFCDEGAGEVIDGVIELTVTDFSGDLLQQSYLVAMDATITDLQVITPSETVTGNGDTSITLDTTQSPFIDAGASGSSLTLDTNTSSETLTNYSSNQTYDGNQAPAEYTLSASGTLDSTQLAGTVDYATGPEFVGLEGSYPHTGQLLVQGDASSARLVAVDSENVRIEVDNNGDGAVDETISLPWSELSP